MARFRTELLRTCRCGKGFVTKKPRQVYCSARCRYRAWNESHIQISLEEWEEYQRLRQAAGQAAPCTVQVT